MTLNQKEISFFKANGYLIIPQALDKSLCALARDALWESLPAGADIKRGDPASHIGPFSAKDTKEDPQDSRMGYRWQLRNTGTEQEMIDLLYSEELFAVSEQLLGKGMVRSPTVGGTTMGSRGYAWPGGPVDPALNSEGIRGIYGTLPYPPGEQHRPPAANAHTDGHPFMLGVVGLIDDCPAGGGAFTVWPGSHKRLYGTFPMQYDQARIPFYEHMPSHKGLIHPPAYHEALEQILDDTQPVDCCGQAGDVVLWHHRLVHAAGENYSNVIRQAVLADYNRIDLDELRLTAPHDNMWHDWSDEVNSAAG